MKRTLCAVGLAALSLAWMPSPAQAVPAALCIAKTLNGALHMRASGTCLAKEIQIGSFDGTTLQLSGINLQIVSGAGATNAPVNGTGNLIVGYNANTGEHARTGSHNLIVGDEHDYGLYGGLVTGLQNTIAAPWTTVIGGNANTANGFGATVTGGVDNTASGFNASVSGGQHNTASGQYSSVSGGWCNVAGAGPAPSCTVNTLSAMSVSGGFRNVASNAVASVSGGAINTASGIDASVSGGENNTASASGASVSGGGTNTASGNRASVSAGDGNTASGTGASVSGGSFNLANGLDTSVSGGPGLSASANFEWHSSRASGFPSSTTY
jgi:hypothetical protein